MTPAGVPGGVAGGYAYVAMTAGLQVDVRNPAGGARGRL